MSMLKVVVYSVVAMVAILYGVMGIIAGELRDAGHLPFLSSQDAVSMSVSGIISLIYGIIMFCCLDVFATSINRTKMRPKRKQAPKVVKYPASRFASKQFAR